MLHRDFFEMGKQDPLGLNVYFEAFVASGNPYYVWLAVEVCVKHEADFPDWLRGYLLHCSERMQSGKAKKGDLHKVLPSVFGFQKKSGPGSLLDPDKGAAGAAARKAFAFRFATKVVQEGHKPSKALVSACNETLDQGRADKITEKTLRRWIEKEFGLKGWPRTAAEWDSLKSVWRERFGPYWSFLEGRQTQKQSPARPRFQIVGK